jgi:hypothetical protein
MFLSAVFLRDTLELTVPSRALFRRYSIRNQFRALAIEHARPQRPTSHRKYVADVSNHRGTSAENTTARAFLSGPTTRFLSLDIAVFLTRLSVLETGSAS